MPELEDMKTSQVVEDQEEKFGAMQSDLSLESQSSTPTTTPLPTTRVNGGTRAWLQVLGSFLVFSNIWGFVFAFGSFQSYYSLTYLPSQSTSSISWIGTTSTFLLILIGIVSGPLFDRGYFKWMLIVGAVFGTASVFLMSVCTKYWQLLLTQGIMMGAFNGLLYLPGIALVSRSFERQKSIAMGIITCGGPTGGVIYTLAFEQLIPRYSFAWTVRFMGFIMLGSYIVALPLLLLRARNLGDLSGPGTRSRRLLDAKALTDPAFWSYSLSNFLIFCGYMDPFVFIPLYGQLVLGLGRSSSLYINMVSQATSIVGRLGMGYMATRTGVLTPWILCATSSGIFSVAWYGVESEASLYAIAALYGCFSGALIPLPPTVFPAVCPDPKVYGTWLGMAQAITSIGSLIGPPIAAALSGGSSGGTYRNDYLGIELFGGIVMIAGGLNLLGLWVLLARRRGEGSKLI